MNELTIFKNKNANLPAYDKEDCKQFSVSSGMSSGMKFIRLNGKEFVSVEGGVKTPIGKTITGIIVNSGDLSKRYYEKAFRSENTRAPDCASADGKAPDPGITNPICGDCETCPKNVWGSKIGFTGKQAKDCQEYRRTIICFTDKEGEHTLYRLDVPAGSLINLKLYGDRLTMARIPMAAVLTTISFDPKVTHQRLEFDALKGFPKETFKLYSELGKSDEALNMLTMQTNSDVDEDDDAYEEEEEEGEEEVVEPPKVVKKKKVVKRGKTVLGPSSKTASKPVPKRRKVKKVIEVYEDEVEDGEEVEEQLDAVEDDAIVVDSAEELADRLDEELEDDLD